jgi:SAM-dependent methyltransferase
MSPRRPHTIHQHPLAYLLGLEGVALLRAFAGEHDRDFTRARIAEIRDLLRRADEFGDGSDVAAMSSERGYDGWAATYDGEPNGAFPIQDEVLLPILDALAPGVTVDAACGTGRISRELVGRGHRVLGFDTSAGMLARARDNVPDAAFAHASYTELPLADACADHMVCTLALGHIEDLGPFFAEAARVLKPGGHLVISDMRGHFIGSGLYPLIKWDVDDAVGYVPQWRHPTGAYVRAALRYGFAVRACEEPFRPTATVADDELPEPLDLTEPPDIWALHPWIPDAANAARDGLPALIVWDFEYAPARG